LVAAYQRETGAPCVSVAVIRGGRDTLAFRGYGVADVENGVPATAATVYPIASLTKQFTAAAVMQLVEEKRIALDDPIGRHLPDLPAGWRGIRIRQLLNHTSGIPDSPVLTREELMPDSVVALAGKKRMESAPGSRWSYSNVGYLVLGLLVEKVTEERYDAYLERRILRHAGLAATRYCDEEAIIPRRASGYVRHGDVVNAPYNSAVPSFSAGGLCSTVGDLAAWNRALATGRVVTPTSYARMTTAEGAAATHGYGYGLIVAPFEGHRMAGHGGTLAGFSSASAYLPDDSLSVTVLTNLGSGNPSKLLLDIVRIALPASPSRPSTKTPPAAPQAGRKDSAGP
ncbi:MAG TPA: serine hydrolase domain-containing protein, partial [Longimicrobiaceae bacterium]|nr:serine hydrolase domain-containing protein [Longimicrobiaceae bacterium]